jgi:hypothetical protein
MHFIELRDDQNTFFFLFDFEAHFFFTYHPDQISIALILGAAMASGLTMGLMSLDMLRFLLPAIEVPNT